MSYKLSGKLATYFRSTRNAWSTRGEIARGLNDSPEAAQRLISMQRKRGHLLVQDGSPLRYRMDAEALYRETDGVNNAELSPKLKKASEAFCARYGVTHPFQATRGSEEALSDWLATLEAA